ncbi:hypothetical protein [Idiomarina abyssalis]|uniref:hypothetical protein n=1 Tax=Idiomarina abyssalis TaxID=86102 RepID=UPI001C94908D|nr:hypothetical protein [Idiomarina abyssalis]QZN90551.1 hypothetical protein K5X84_10365 [Idiomarina abyssalis]
MNLNDLHRTILKELYLSSDGLDIYTLFKRSHVGFSTFFKALISLEEEKYILSNNNKKYKLGGDAFNETGASKIAFGRATKEFRSVPKRFKAPKLKKNEFYTPSLSKLDSAVVKS